MTWTIEELAKEARRYKTRTAFQKGSRNAYTAAWRRGLLDELCVHMTAERKNWTDQELFAIAASYESRKDFQKNDNAAYQVARRRALLSECCMHMGGKQTGTGNRKWTLEKLLEEAQKYTTRAEFYREQQSAYAQALYYGLMDAVCAHMDRAYGGFNPDFPGTVYFLKIDSPILAQAVYKVGITNRKVNERIKEMRLVKNTTITVIDCLEFVNGHDAMVLEKYLHKKYKSYAYFGGKELIKNGWTELFAQDIWSLENP
jgi:hypothetical protein